MLSQRLTLESSTLAFIAVICSLALLNTRAADALPTVQALPFLFNSVRLLPPGVVQNDGPRSDHLFKNNYETITSVQKSL